MGLIVGAASVAVTCGMGVFMTVVFVSESPPHAMDKMIRDSGWAMILSERRDSNVKSLLCGGFTIPARECRVSEIFWNFLQLFALWFTKSRNRGRVKRRRLLGVKARILARNHTYITKR